MFDLPYFLLLRFRLMKSKRVCVSPRICIVDSDCQVHSRGVQYDGERGEEEDDQAVEARAK